MKRLAWLALLLLAGRLPAADPALPKRLLVWVPQTEDQAPLVLKVLDEQPALRLVWAVSPRFFRLPKDVEIRNRLKELEAQGRIALALQIPNGPLLPLLDDRDTQQHVVRAKAAFAKTWGAAPRGLVVPYGAVSPDVVRGLDRQGFAWLIAALGQAAPMRGGYRMDSFLGLIHVRWFDAGQSPDPASDVVVRIWDERDTSGGGAKVLAAWAAEASKGAGTWTLPDDPTWPDPQSLDLNAVRPRTWTKPDLSYWSGSPDQERLRAALSRTRSALDAYQNSGSANIQRLDAAWDEYLTAQNANYLRIAGAAPALDRDERLHDFEATLGSAYRLIGQPAPEDLLASAEASVGALAEPGALVVTAETLSDGRERLRISDAVMQLDLMGSPAEWLWSLSVSSAPAQWTFDIYIDLNGLPGVGSMLPLPGRQIGLRPEEAWEYAVSLSSGAAALYRTQGGGTYVQAGSFPAAMQGTRWQWRIPRELLKGSARRWRYRFLLMGPQFDTLYTSERKNK